MGNNNPGARELKTQEISLRSLAGLQGQGKGRGTLGAGQDSHPVLISARYRATVPPSCKKKKEEENRQGRHLGSSLWTNRS